MITTEVINIHDAPKGWETNPKYVYIGRAGKGLDGKWGNPFALNSEEKRASIVQNYMRYIKYQIDLPNWREDIKNLRGKILVCFCSPKLCHGDILALLAEVL